MRKGKLTDYGHDREGARMAREILSRWQMPSDFTDRVVWLVENHMKFHYFANFGEANALKWVRSLARNKTFRSSADMAEAFHQMTDLGNADIIGCGRSLSDTAGHSEFGRYMEEVSLSVPVTTRELHYGKDVPRLLGNLVGEGMQNLLLRVQNGNLENSPAALYDAAVRFKRRREHEKGTAQE